MFKRKIITCAFVGGFILFFWAALSFTLLPSQKNQMKSFSDEKEVRDVIVDNIEGSGLYILPNLKDFCNKPAKLEAAKKRMEKGPFVVASVRACGKSSSMIGDAVVSLIFKIVSAGLATWLLMRTHHHRAPDTASTVKFMVIVGVLVGLSTTVPYFIWFGFPLSFTLGSFIEILFGWLFAGLAIGSILSRGSINPRLK
jgi:hypothetical protein